MTVEEIQNHMPIWSNSLFIWHTAHGSQHREVKKSFTNDPCKNHNIISWKKTCWQCFVHSQKYIHKHVKYMFSSLDTKLYKSNIGTIYIFMSKVFMSSKSKL